MKNKKRLLAVLLAAATVTCAGAFGGCNSDDDSGSGKPENGIQVDGEQWATEINKFKLDNNLSELDSYTIKAEMSQSINGQTLTQKFTEYVNRKDKELYIPDSKSLTTDDGSSTTLYCKLGEPYMRSVNGEQMSVCEYTDLSYTYKNSELVLDATKRTFKDEDALLLFNNDSLLTVFEKIKIGEDLISLSEAEEYFEYDGTNGTYKSKDKIGINDGYGLKFPTVDGVTMLEILHVFYMPCDVKICIKESSFTAKIEYILTETNPESGETVEISLIYNFEICNFNSTTIALTPEHRAELDKLNN